MRRIISALIFSFSTALACAQAAKPLELAPGAPERHIVVPGDTLWGIAAKFLKDPYRWAELWKLNAADIKNPQRIYPGQVLVLDKSGSEPQLKLETVKLQQHEYGYQSIHDPLTGLYNRRHLDTAFPQSLISTQEEQQSLSVLLTDIDYFKRFNDSYGHKAGDVVLKLVSQVVQSILRQSDMAFRYGGEELVIILPATSILLAQQIAEELRLRIKNLQQEYSYHFLEGITISIGIAGFPEHGNSCDDLLQLADAALYQAKSEGRDRVVLAPILLS